MCAFTSKAVGFARMMADLGRDVTVYWAGDETDEPCAEFVSLMSERERIGWFGNSVQNAPGDVIKWDASKRYWKTFLDASMNALHDRIAPGDIIAITGGCVQQRVVDAFPDIACIETCAGYEGIANRTHVCFESYAWQHYIYGKKAIVNGRWLDAVIPGYVNPMEFSVSHAEDPPYALYLGRMTSRKGVDLAVEIAEAAEIRLIMAGTGDVLPRGPELVGAVNPAERKRLLSHATVLLVPTLYIEPYGTVHVEALMSGVPVCAPDFGVFTGTLPESSRFRSFKEALDIVAAAREETSVERSARARQARRDFAPALLAEKWAAWLDVIDALADGRNGFYRNTIKGRIA